MTSGTVLASLFLFAVTAPAATIPVACQSAKQKEAGGLAKCLENAQSKLVSSGDAVAYGAAVAKCTTKFSDKWDGAEQKAIDKGGTCQTSADKTQVQESIEANVACIASALQTGDKTCLLCGNGAIEAGEDCDLGTLGGATCATATGGALPDGSLGCSADCDLDTSGCSASSGGPPACAPLGSACGSCGDGICVASIPGGSLGCVAVTGAFPSPCTSDAMCPAGMYCIEGGGLPGCAFACP